MSRVGARIRVAAQTRCEGFARIGAESGRHVEAALGTALDITEVQLGDTVKVKYVSDDPEQAYLAAYQPRYIAAIFMGSLFLAAAALVGWSMRREWASRNANWAAEKLRAETPLAPPPAPSRKSRRKALRKYAIRPRNPGGDFVARARRRSSDG